MALEASVFACSQKQCITGAEFRSDIQAYASSSAHNRNCSCAGLIDSLLESEERWFVGRGVLRGSLGAGIGLEELQPEVLCVLCEATSVELGVREERVELDKFLAEALDKLGRALAILAYLLKHTDGRALIRIAQ